jgi:hypothetical protein
LTSIGVSRRQAPSLTPSSVRSPTAMRTRRQTEWPRLSNARRMTRFLPSEIVILSQALSRFFFSRLTEIGTNRPSGRSIPFASDWISFFPRTEVEHFTGGIISEKYLANLDCAGKGPAGRIRTGRKISYPVTSFIEWLESRSAAIPNRHAEE